MCAPVCQPAVRALLWLYCSRAQQRHKLHPAWHWHAADTTQWDYHFKAALSELRTEQSIRARTAGEALRSKATAMRREVDNVDQRMKGDLQDMRHEWVHQKAADTALTAHSYILKN